MSFSVDQFMQVKCKLTLTSESESSESEASETIHTNNEQIRLCKSVQMDANNHSTLIVMVCSNETSNNHILAYYIERPQLRSTQSVPAGNGAQSEQAAGSNGTGHQNVSIVDGDEQTNENVALTKLAKLAANSVAPSQSQLTSPSASSPNSINNRPRPRLRPRIIVKQIYYHPYNEDIVAICLNQNGTKLVLINASSTIYIIPLKNILLNLHAQQLRSSQGRSMCFYDASIVKPCAQRSWSLSDPFEAVLWEAASHTDEQHQPSVLVIANRDGKLNYINLDDKREICSHHVNEPIKSLEIVRDGQNQNLLITCTNFSQYRQVLSFSEIRDNSDKSQQQEIPKPVRSQRKASLIGLSLSRFKTRTSRTNELITNLVLTERFIAFTTDRERCIINSRNCCRLKSSSSGPSQTTLRSARHVNPLIKEISFNHEERIMMLVKSPISNDHDNIIDSFLLVTTRSIYSIEARHSCRELFINLIDTHLAIKRTLFLSKAQIIDGEQTLSSFNLERLVTTATTATTTSSDALNSHQAPIKANYDSHRNAESELLINNFLQNREVYERVSHDSLAFSALFKLELHSLYEAYGDRLLQRGQLILADRFYQMASLDHKKILGKYIRVGFIDAKRKQNHSEKGQSELNEQQKYIAENIFIKMMTACLDESTDDSCRLWSNYINFYLGYIANLEALQTDILRMTEAFGDCRLAISLYKAIHRDESLANLFKNDFLMRLLDRTLDLLPQHVELDTLIIATMC